MPKFVKKLVSVAIIAGISFQFVPTTEVKAIISSCSASVVQHSAYINSSVDFSIQITNTAQEDISWIRIQNPSSGDFTIQGSSVSGWDASGDAVNQTLTAGSLPSGQSLNVVVTATTGSQPRPSADWFVEVSDDGGGSNPFACPGNLGTEIIDPADQPVISNISVSSITTSSAIISWDTNELANGAVNYGFTSSYGSNQNNPNLTTAHSFTLENLSPNATYHFKVLSADVFGTSSQSGDNTFLTPAASQSGQSSSSGPSSSTSTGESILKELKLKATEKIPPTMTISTDFSKPFTAAPTIVGTASDNEAIYLVEYSTDNGKNWLPVNNLVGQGQKQASFDFTPINLDDGNYKIVARATDTSGNQASSQTYTLVIDRLPPTVGAGVISIGPQVLKPDSDGVVTTVAGLDQKVTLASVGGATQVTIRSVDTNVKSGANSQVFALSRSSQTGLWSGILSFSKEGLNTLSVEALDGAGNKTKRDFGNIQVLSGGQITEKDSKKPITQAKITLYYLETESNSWVVWDGSSYGQKNPQQTSKDGQFRFFAPAGKYYLQISASGYKTVISKIFAVDQTVPLAQSISLEKATKIGFDPLSFTLPSLTLGKIEIVPSQKKVDLAKTASSLVDKSLPSFNLEKTSGGTTNHVQLSGKPTLLSFVSTWSPASQEQFQVLDKLQNNQDLNISPVVVMESTAKLVSYKAISKLELDFLVDPDGTTVSSFGYQSLPTHYFVNRKGIIKKITIGVLSEKEILDNLGAL